MLRLTRFVRNPLLLAMFPFSTDNPYDKPKSNIIDVMKIDDELGWDRVKKIFMLNEYHAFTKELQSIINMTVSGFAIGAVLGGMKTTDNTVHNFISRNEAIKFDNHFHAKRDLSLKIMENFFIKGGKMGVKLGLFCLMFSCLTTCTTAYRGKLKVENYILGGSVTGLLFKMNLGIRGALVGAGLAGTLGAICGVFTLIIINLSGISMDEVLQVQNEWITSRNTKLKESIKKGIAKEAPELEKVMEANQKLQMLLNEKKSVKDINDVYDKT